MTDDEFPSYYAKRDGKLEEEKRLFYVALTRAKRHVVVTSHTSDAWGRNKRPSGFLTFIIYPSIKDNNRLHHLP